MILLTVSAAFVARDLRGSRTTIRSSSFRIWDSSYGVTCVLPLPVAMERIVTDLEDDV